MFELLFVLVACHALADFPFQSEAIAINKNRNAKTDLQKHVPYYYWLGAHSLTHGLLVAFFTGSFILGALETVCHYVIDFMKCEGKFSIHVDQILHVLCKMVWILLMFAAGVGV